MIWLLFHPVELELVIEALNFYLLNNSLPAGAKMDVERLKETLETY